MVQAREVVLRQPLRHRGGLHVRFPVGWGEGHSHVVLCTVDSRNGECYLGRTEHGFVTGQHLLRLHACRVTPAQPKVNALTSQTNPAYPGSSQGTHLPEGSVQVESAKHPPLNSCCWEGMLDDGSTPAARHAAAEYLQPQHLRRKDFGRLARIVVICGSDAAQRRPWSSRVSDGSWMTYLLDNVLVSLVGRSRSATRHQRVSKLLRHMAVTQHCTPHLKA
jgi:hypothetical protein